MNEFKTLTSELKRKSIPFAIQNKDGESFLLAIKLTHKPDRIGRVNYYLNGVKVSRNLASYANALGACY